MPEQHEPSSEEVTARLAAAATSEPVPEDVAESIAAALRHEHRMRASAGGPSGNSTKAGPSTSGAESPTARGTRTWSRRLLAAAAGIGILAVGGVTYQALQTDDVPTAGTAMDSSVEAEAPESAAASELGPESDESTDLGAPARGSADGSAEMVLPDLPPLSPPLLEQASALAAQASPSGTTCGLALADQQRARLLAAEPADPGAPDPSGPDDVLVLLENAGQLDAWLLPDCQAGAADARARSSVAR
jgi:hypothetical protein